MAASMPSAAVPTDSHGVAAGLATRSRSFVDPSARYGGHLEEVVMPESPFGDRSPPAVRRNMLRPVPVCEIDAHPEQGPTREDAG